MLGKSINSIVGSGIALMLVLVRYSRIRLREFYEFSAEKSFNLFEIFSHAESRLIFTLSRSRFSLDGLFQYIAPRRWLIDDCDYETPIRDSADDISPRRLYLIANFFRIVHEWQGSSFKLRTFSGAFVLDSNPLCEFVKFDCEASRACRKTFQRSRCHSAGWRRRMSMGELYIATWWRMRQSGPDQHRK